MTARPVIHATNLGGEDFAELAWERVEEPLRTGALGSAVSILSTTRPDGRPHATRVGALWLDGAIYFQSGASSRKVRNLHHNAAAVMNASVPGMDLSFEGTVTRERNPTHLAEVAAAYRANGWPAEVEGEGLTAPYNAPGTGPAPWNVYRFDIHAVFGVATEEPYGATKWSFASPV